MWNGQTHIQSLSHLISNVFKYQFAPIFSSILAHSRHRSHFCVVDFNFGHYAAGSLDVIVNKLILRVDFSWTKFKPRHKVFADNKHRFSKLLVSLMGICSSREVNMNGSECKNTKSLDSDSFTWCQCFLNKLSKRLPNILKLVLAIHLARFLHPTQ